MRKLLALIVVFLLAASFAAQVKISGTAKVGGTAKVSATAAAGPSDFVTDTFTEAGASTQDLNTHTGELGATWTHHPHANYTSTTILDQTLDEIYTTQGTTAYFASGTPPSADYCAEGVIVVYSLASANASVAVRMDTTADTMYIFRLNSGTSWDVRKIVAGTATTLPAATTDTTNLPGVGESRTMKLCVVGTTLSAYVDGVQLSTLGGTDSAISAAGKAGIRYSGIVSSSTGYHFSSFRAF